MKSTAISLDVTSALASTGFGDDQKVEIAATLHLPDDMPDGKLHLIFALHGGGYSRKYWHPEYVDESYSFARWFTDQGKAVLAIDMLGMGESSKPEPESNLSGEIITAAHASALSQVAEQLNRPLSITGIGHSMGGMMIIAQAAAHPVFDRVATLGWANEPMILGDTDVSSLQAELIPSGYLPTPREPMRKLFYWPDVPQKVIDADEENASRSPATLGKLALTPKVMHADAARIKVPVLIVHSELDTSPSPDKEPAYFSSAASTELQILPNAAHCQNFAGNRAQHWADLNDWIDRTK